MQTKIKVSGNIISELSEKIPVNIVALNELIKNAYDAGATEIKIKMDTTKKTICIEDNGNGMDEFDIEKLFHISNSDKKYGSINQNGRLTQGSKGLGFLSAFKFGKQVKWITCKENQGIEFCVDYDDVIKYENISDYIVNIKANEKKINGTIIEIKVREDNDNFESLIKYFKKEENYLKVLYSFLDDNFIIEIQIDNNIPLSNRNKVELKNILPTRQIYNVKYSSDKEKIEFYYKNKNVISKPYKFNSNRYTLDMNLIVYSLKSYDKDKITKLFRNNNDELTPLIYVNDNLFNNYDMFNPNVNMKKKYSEILPQIIGYINIVTDDKEMGFNSDRTQFIQNGLTENIREFLSNLNSIIQSEGTSYKNKISQQKFLKDDIKYDDIKGKNFMDAVKDNFELKEEVEIEETKDEIIYRIFNVEEKIEKKIEFNQGDKENNIEDKKAYIKLASKSMRIEVKSNQIDLYENIKEAKNSHGENIKYKVKILADGIELENGILESQEKSCTINIDYIYLDDVTKKTQETMSIQYYIPTMTMNTIKRDKRIIELDYLKNGYTINYNGYVEKIHNEINKLTSKFEDFKELISCSLRAIFEISADEIENCDKYNNRFYDKELKKEIENIIMYVVSNPSIMSEISNSTRINYKDLMKKIKIEDFKNAIDNAHMGAHKSSTYLSSNDILDLAQKAGYFMVITNEMINNENIQ